MASPPIRGDKAKPRTATGGSQSDHIFRPSLELDHNTVDHSSRQGYHKPPAPLGGRGLKGERGFFSSDETALTKQILATHAPDIDDLNVKPVLAIVEDILRLAKPSTSADASSLVRRYRCFCT